MVEMIDENRSNWAGNYTYKAGRLHYPETIEQVRQLVSRAHKVRVLGSRHSFNAIADTPGDLISLERIERVFEIDTERSTLTVDGGVKYGQVCEMLHRKGYALHNLASLPHISIAGACATATHGSGDRNGNLSTALSAMELVTADGSVVKFSREPGNPHSAYFPGAAVHLGGLGAVTKITLYIVPTFDMRQDVYENLPVAALKNHFDTIFTGAYSASLFTDWKGEHVDQVWLKRIVKPGDDWTAAPELFGATLATTRRHPIAGISPEPCTEQMGVRGPWHDRLPHFRMGFTPSSGEELQTEYIIPRRHSVDAYFAIHRLRDHIAPLVQVSEVRSIAADDLWLSPCYQQACIGVHFTWVKDWKAVKRVLPMIEAELQPFQARPHWAKLFTMEPSWVQALYPRLPDFQRMMNTYDPQGKFRNDFLDTFIFGRL